MSLRPRHRRALIRLAWIAAFAFAACEASDPVARARRLQADGDYSGSLEPLRNLIATRPEDPELNYLYGLALVRTQQPSLAIWSLRRAMQDPKWRAAAASELAGGALATGNPDEAIAVVGQLLESEPENVQALTLRAEARLYSRRDYPGALADAEAALALDPDHFDARVARATALLGLERVKEAEAALDELEATVSEADLGLDAGAKFCLVRASFTVEKGDVTGAAEQYERCLREFPADARVIAAAVAYYDEQQRPERATEILRGALAEEPEASSWRVMLAARLEEGGSKDEALTLLREGTESPDPEMASVGFVDLANLYTAREEFGAAASALQKAVELSPAPRPELRFQHAETLVMAGDLARARELAARLEVPAHRELIEARALLAEGNPAEALERFEVGLRLWPDNAIARYYAAIAAEQLGDFDRAIGEYRYAVRAGPGETDARARLARLHEAEGAEGNALGVATQQGPALPPDHDAECVALRILARKGQIGDARTVSDRYAGDPELWAKAVAAMAEGMREREGPAGAARWIRESGKLDLTDPRSAPALRELIVSLGDAGDHAGALAAVDAALAAHPDAAAFHTLKGDALLRRGGDAAAARTAFERAQALDGDQVAALAGLARLASERGDAQAALDLYARAAAAERADFGDSAWRRAWAELLVSLGREQEAEARLRDLLRRNPYDGAAAARQVELRLAREQAPGAETLALAHRAVRFGATPERWDLLARAYRLRGDAPRADAAAKRAAELRARAGGVADRAEPAAS